MGMEFLNGKVEIFTVDSIKMMREMVMERWFGLMNHNTTVNGSEESKMGLVQWFSPMGLSKMGTLTITFM
jgi:hypothetical protein